MRFLPRPSELEDAAEKSELANENIKKEGRLVLYDRILACGFMGKTGTSTKTVLLPRNFFELQHPDKRKTHVTSINPDPRPR